MAQKHLKELLKEDQEPFHLKDYIEDRQCQLKKQANRTQIQLKKPKPISKNTSFLGKNACFFSLQDSPDPHKSPLFDFPKSPNRVVLHVPPKTASMLLEAAMRIQRGKKKLKTQMKNSGFGLFGSMLNRLKPRNKVQKMKGNKTGEGKTGENRGEVIVEEKVVNATSSTLPSSSSSSSSGCSCNGRMSSLDLESSISGRSFNGDNDNGGFEFANVVRKNVGEYGLCLSPFHFSLHSSHSSVKSPVCHKIKIQEEADEKDKKQSSPISVLDPLFDDDYDVHEEDDDYDLECNYPFAQRTEQQLLHKLHMFEKWADLDPIELEKRLIEDRDEQLVLEQEEDYEEYDYESFTFDDQERQVDEFINDTTRKSRFQDIRKLGVKRLVSDLIIEEECANNNALESDEQLIKMVCKRLKSWKEVEGNTIDMMVEMDLRREIGGWKKPQEHIDEVAIDLEVATFATLVDELVEDLLNFT